MHPFLHLLITLHDLSRPCSTAYIIVTGTGHIDSPARNALRRQNHRGYEVKLCRAPAGKLRRANNLASGLQNLQEPLPNFRSSSDNELKSPSRKPPGYYYKTTKRDLHTMVNIRLVLARDLGSR